MKEKRGLTPTADKWARKLLLLDANATSGLKDDISNPFYLVNDELYMRFDLIVLEPGVEGGVVVKYCYNGEHICTFPVKDMEMSYVGPGMDKPLLNLEGIKGSMKMVLI